MKREEAVSLIKELLDCCKGLDGHTFELIAPSVSSPATGGYKIIIKGVLDQETKNRIIDILQKHQLAYQSGSLWRTKQSLNKEPDTLIIYKHKVKNSDFFLEGS